MKIFIIGKNGQVAKALTHVASQENNLVFSFNRSEFDITNYSKAYEILHSYKPDVVINTAAYHANLKNENDPRHMFKVNFLGVCNLARICKSHTIQFVTYSSDYVFDGRKGTPYTEENIPNPLQLYGMSKFSGEYGSLLEYPEGAFIIRTSGIYGSGQIGSPTKGNFVLNIINESQNKDIIEVSSEQVVSTSYSNDLARATLLLLKKHTSPGIYHLINEGHCSWYEFAKEVFTYLNIKNKLLPIDRGGYSGGILRPKYSALQNIKARRNGVVLQHWKDALRCYVEELKISQ